MPKDWMSGGVVENDAEEARSARIAAEAAGEDHGPSCRCRDCILDEFDPRDAL